MPEKSVWITQTPTILRMKRYLLLPLLLLSSLCCARGEDAVIKPLMLVPDKVIFTDDFSDSRGELKFNKKDENQPWQPNQGTRWAVTNGVLHGRASSPEFQASHDTHKGVHPRIVLTKTPENYILKFSMKIVDGTPFEATKRRSVPPFIEIGHHICRVTWATNGAVLLAEGDSLQLANDKDFKLTPGKWQQVLVERRKDEVVVQFANGPTFYGKHPSYISDKHAVMLGGLEAGTMDVDDVTVWSLKDGDQPDWSKARTKFPAPQNIRLKQPKAAEDAAPAKAKK